MEDQNENLALDASNLSFVSAESADEENIYTLPFWGGENGYRLLEDFTSGLKNEKVYSSLRKILTEGRGVFRNFKNELKKYPEIEHGFYIYKENAMKVIVMDWYNALRESWGLEKLDYDIEEYQDLVLEDFIFDEYNYTRDNNCIAEIVSAEAERLGEELPVEFSLQAKDLWLSQFADISGDSVNGFVCRTLSEEFAGCILFSLCPSPSTASAKLTGLVVAENYRGLGIAKELVEKCISSLRAKGISWLLIAANFIPLILEPLFDRLGFKKMGNVYAADLTKL